MESMARYFFDISSGAIPQRDMQGQEHETVRAAQDEAMSTLLKIARVPPVIGSQNAIAVQVRDEAGDVVYRATLSLAVERSA
jgi:hypothetical protein